MRTFDDETFTEVVAAPAAVIMFTACWAGPCNLIRPSFEYLAGRFGNQILFGEFDVDDNPDIPEMYGVRSLPWFMTMKNGVPQKVMTGAMYEDQLETILEGML